MAFPLNLESLKLFSVTVEKTMTISAIVLWQH
jgi:hypothetical protein